MDSYNSDHHYLLLDFATAINIFYDKNKFINFRRVIKGQKLLYCLEIIMIEGQRKRSLSSKIRN